MLATVIAEFASAMSTAVLSAADDEGGSAWLLALGPVGAGGVYYVVWRYYRNTQRSHGFERETRIEAQPATGHDAKVREIKGTRSSRIDGENHSDHRQRVQRLE